jgi:hypothetical protein
LRFVYIFAHDAISQGLGYLSGIIHEGKFNNIYTSMELRKRFRIREEGSRKPPSAFREVTSTVG